MNTAYASEHAVYAYCPFGTVPYSAWDDESVVPWRKYRLASPTRLERMTALVRRIRWYEQEWYYRSRINKVLAHVLVVTMIVAIALMIDWSFDLNAVGVWHEILFASNTSPLTIICPSLGDKCAEWDVLLRCAPPSSAS